MSELTPLPTAQRPSDGGYQPVSGFAVAAIIAAGVFVVFLAVVFLSALSSRRTAMAYELLLLPALGLGLAVAARSHLKRSEGTRSGAKLASTAWWICILGGAGYSAYLMANEYFIDLESRNFAERFFDDLKADKPYHAFAYLIDPAQRENANPDNPESLEAQFGQMYGAFRNLDVVREFRRNKGDIKIEHVGSVDIGQEAEGFKATHIYRMETPEGIFDVRVSLKAAEARKGGKPLWKIVSRPNIGVTIRPEKDKLSEYGRLIFDIEAEVSSLVRFWTDTRVQRIPLKAHLFTFPGQEREKIENALGRMTLLGGATAGLWPVSPAILPADRRKAREEAEVARMSVAGGAILTQTIAWTSFDDLFDIGFFKRLDENTPFTPDQLLKLRHLWRNPLLGLANLERPLPPNVMPSEVTRLFVEDDRIRFVVPIDWQTNDLKSFYKASLTIVCEEPEVVQKIKESRKKGISAPAKADMLTKEIPPRRWRIVMVQTDLEAIAPQTPGMPPKGPN